MDAPVFRERKAVIRLRQPLRPPVCSLKTLETLADSESVAETSLRYFGPRQGSHRTESRQSKTSGLPASGSFPIRRLCRPYISQQPPCLATRPESQDV